MIWSLFSIAPLLAFLWIFVVVMSLSVHECCHALAGKLLGDTTAERAGRLTLNPFAHLDPVGFLMLLFIGFGWAKPVPYNPHALQHPIRDSVLIGLAGPASNILLALLSGAVFYMLVVSGIVSTTSMLAIFLVLTVFINGILAAFNVIPLPPLDGSKIVDAILAATRQHELAAMFTRFGSLLLLGLVIVSSTSNIPIFDFISFPASWFCDVVLTPVCTEVFSHALGA